MSFKSNDCLIIIPAFNAEHMIKNVLDNLQGYNALVVDDGSRDKTETIVKRFNQINYIKLSENHGVGYALKKGFEYAAKHNFKYAITIDSDGQHDSTLIARFLPLLGEKIIVLGNRFSDLTKIPHQKLCSNFFAKLLFKKNTKFDLLDVSCGFRGYEISKVLFECEMTGYGYLYESLKKLLVKGYNVKYVDIPVIYPFDELLCTKVEEIQGFLESFKKNHIEGQEVSKLLKKISNRENLFVEIEGIKFSLIYIKSNNSYICQSDFNRIFQLNSSG